MTAGVDSDASTLLSQHAAHVLAVAIPLVMLAIGLLWDGLRRRVVGRARVRLPASPALQLAAAASAVAGVVHAAVLPEHAAESPLYGGFFAAAAFAQFGGAWLLLTRPSRVLVTFVAAGNAAIVVLWLVTRLVEVPLGPAAGTVEPFGSLDITAGLLESLVVVACLRCLYGLRFARSHPTSPRLRGQTMP